MTVTGSADQLMLVTNQLPAAPTGGRELLSKLNHDALHKIYGGRLIVVELPRQPVRGIKSIIGAFKGHIDGLNSASIHRALDTIKLKRIGKVFIDGSNFGELVKAVKDLFPSVEVITFFHNVEARFFLGSLNLTRSLRALAVLVVNYRAEQKSVRCSDKIVCLSERDSRLLRKLYGRAATHIAPMALEDKFPTGPDFAPPSGKEEFLLFVGGMFYANRAGISWFVEHVVPRIEMKTCIVGRGFEDIKHELERAGKVEVIGAADRLSGWYRDAKFVIAPIFDGSGMKTKVAEALMYGKKVVGTPEAFSGYEDVLPQAGWMCETRDEFVSAIGEAQTTITQSFDINLRKIYEQRYSMTAATERLRQILS